jgi:hypothetical protein
MHRNVITWSLYVCPNSVQSYLYAAGRSYGVKGGEWKSPCTLNRLYVKSITAHDDFLKRHLVKHFTILNWAICRAIWIFKIYYVVF